MNNSTVNVSQIKFNSAPKIYRSSFLISYTGDFLSGSYTLWAVVSSAILDHWAF